MLIAVWWLQVAQTVLCMHPLDGCALPMCALFIYVFGKYLVSPIEKLDFTRESTKVVRAYCKLQPLWPFTKISGREEQGKK